MIDFARITVRAGDGGNGAGSFHKIKGRRYGRADGGDGGRGGDVYFEASSDLNGLDNFRFVKDYQAERGQNGLSRRRRGAEGVDLVLKVPVGTEIKLVDDRFQIMDKKQKIQYPE
ncbi:MAG: GTPase ObgE, partial [Candidatus Curtissbacteria bacterium]|nr:GTPase ObgE [Candidatus Curtissbacteria bacterium]